MKRLILPFILTAISMGGSIALGNEKACGLLTGVQISLEAAISKKQYRDTGSFPTFYDDEKGTAAKMYIENRAAQINALGKSLSIKTSQLFKQDSREAQQIQQVSGNLVAFRTSVDALTVRKSNQQESFIINQDTAIKSLSDLVGMLAEIYCSK